MRKIIFRTVSAMNEYRHSVMPAHKCVELTGRDFGLCARHQGAMPAIALLAPYCSSCVNATCLYTCVHCVCMHDCQITRRQSVQLCARAFKTAEQHRLILLCRGNVPELTSIKLITDACKNERKTVCRLVSACNNRHKFPALCRQ